ncbi:MAG: SdrD B-like domain-containing protein, partial [Syntrophales bacterium]|nr:SdrD B-like domain-containing protein [Syntrophales bacterium]
MGIKGKIFSIIMFLLFMIVSGGRGWCATPPGAIIENKAAANYADGNGNPYLAQSNMVQTAAGAGPLFKIEQTLSSDPVPQNQLLTFSITAINTGNAPATGSVLTAQLPPGTAFIQADRNGAFSGGKVEWSLGNINADGSVTVNVTVRVLPDIPEGTALPNWATIICIEGSAASSIIAPLVGTGANVSIALSTDRTEVSAGGNIIYTVSVINIGPVKIENLALNASLPQYADFMAASNNGAANGGVVSWNIAALLPGEKINYTFETRVFTSTSDGTVVTSSASIAAAQLASRTSNAVAVLVKNKQAIVLTPNPVTIIANGTDSSILTARAVDYAGNPLPDGTPIRFFTDQGTFLDGNVTTATITVPISGGNGEAKTPLTAPLLTHPATAHVQATIGPVASNIVELKILPGVASIYVYDVANKRAVTASDQNYTVSVIIENYPQAVTVDTNGLWIIPRLEPGNYKIYTIVTDKTGREIIRTPEKTITIEQNTVTELPVNSLEGKLEERDGSKIYAGVKVNLYDATGTFIAETTTDNNGIYRFPDITPGNFYRINARLPDGRGVILTTPYLTKRSGVILVAANLLVDPYGIVYDSITGAPLSGVTVWILNPDGTPAALPDPTEAPGAVNTNPLITGADGTYQWPLIA